MSRSKAQSRGGIRPIEAVIVDGRCQKPGALKGAVVQNIQLWLPLSAGNSHRASQDWAIRPASTRKVSMTAPPKRPAPDYMSRRHDMIAIRKDALHIIRIMRRSLLGPIEKSRGRRAAVIGHGRMLNVIGPQKMIDQP
jgi:hypothetical protein